MDINLHSNILISIKKFTGLSRNCIKKLEEEFPSISSDTLFSILSIEYQRKMKKNYGKQQNNRTKFWKLFKNRLENGEKSGILIRLAESYDIPPCLLARLILQTFYENKENHQNINNCLKNTNLIPDEHLAYEIFLCTINDNLYSPYADAMKHSLGQQYEIRLTNEAAQLGLTFRGEDFLRKSGYDKTPDLKLEVPIAIDGFIINWIESKALFADEQLHKYYMLNQYSSYWNRFGPGLVIYWFGYLNGIAQLPEKRFIIRDHLPQNNVLKLDLFYSHLNVKSDL